MMSTLSCLRHIAYIVICCLRFHALYNVNPFFNVLDMIILSRKRIMYKKGQPGAVKLLQLRGLGKG